MKLNVFETYLMNNPIRSWLQKVYEAPNLKRISPKPTEGSRTLILGCGRGVDVEIAMDQYKVASVHAVDIDENQIERAKNRLQNRYGEKVTLQVGDVSEPIFDEGYFDLVIDFGIIHHIPRWQQSIDQVSRILKAGGIFLFEEVPKRKLDTMRYRLLTDHPKENRFGSKEFAASCRESGLRLVNPIELFFGFFRGAAVKPE